MVDIIKKLIDEESIMEVRFSTEDLLGEEKLCRNCNHPIVSEPVENIFCSQECLDELDNWCEGYVETYEGR
tara:strand:- start:204 stop:416 length:213 start_codon:yes stop_codon:yes gene_type:complete